MLFTMPNPALRLCTVVLLLTLSSIKPYLTCPTMMKISRLERNYTSQTHQIENRETYLTCPTMMKISRLERNYTSQTHQIENREKLSQKYLRLAEDSGSQWRQRQRYIDRKLAHQNKTIGLYLKCQREYYAASFLTDAYEGLLVFMNKAKRLCGDYVKDYEGYVSQYQNHFNYFKGQSLHPMYRRCTAYLPIPMNIAVAQTTRMLYFECLRASKYIKHSLITDHYQIIAQAIEESTKRPEIRK
uniref:Uncharacterized protein n=1 Tax=Trichobilharzia regenti TaxID=157069 RepID=A0AA85KFY5_TRIRE|nr:unnamed protein product [Trichobilharzia regenti]